MTAGEPENEKKEPPPDDLRDEARMWLVRLSSGDMDPPEKARFERWLDTSAAHKDAFAYEQAAWRQAEFFRQQLGPETWAAEDKAPPETDHIAASPPRAVFARKAALSGMALAAALLVAVFAGDVWLALVSDHRTASGEQMRISLPDGSTVYLNTDSAIDVDYTEPERRIVLLRGEAYFAVASNPKRPFVVQSHGRLTRAIGTAFAVRDNSGRVSVTVTEGRIEVVPDTDGDRRDPSTKSVRASVDQQVVYRAGGEALPARQVDAKAVLAWRDGKIVFEDVPFGEVIAELDRYRPGRIIVAPTVSTERQVSGVFSPKSLDSAIGTLAAMQGVTMRTLTPYLTILH